MEMRTDANGLPLTDFTSPISIDALHVTTASRCKMLPASEECKQLINDLKFTLAANKCYADQSSPMCEQLKPILKPLCRVSETSQNLTSMQGLRNPNTYQPSVPVINPYTDKKFKAWLCGTEVNRVKRSRLTQRSHLINKKILSVAIVIISLVLIYLVITGK